MKYLKQYEEFGEFDYIIEGTDINPVHKQHISDFAVWAANDIQYNPRLTKLVLDNDFYTRAYQGWINSAWYEYYKNNGRHNAPISEDDFKSKMEGDIPKEAFKNVAEEAFKKEKISKFRKKFLSVMAIIGTAGVIIGAIGGAIMSLRGLMIAHIKNKNKKLTGSDKLTEVQEEELYKLLFLSKVMVIVGGVGGALRSLKFLFKIFHDYGYDNDPDSMSHLGDIKEGDNYKDVSVNLLKIVDNSKPLIKIIDKLNVIKGLKEMLNNIQSKVLGLNEDFIIEICKFMQVINDHIPKPEQAQLMKFSQYTAAVLHESIDYVNVNEGVDKDVEHMSTLAMDIIGMDKINSILEKVWDQNVEKTIDVCKNAKDNALVLLKITEIKKNIDAKLDHAEQQALLQFISKTKFK